MRRRGSEETHIIERIHPKACPVSLQEEDEDRWVDRDVREVCSLAAPFPSQLMQMAA